MVLLLSSIVVKINVNNLVRGLIKYPDDPAMKCCLKRFSCNLGTVYRKGESAPLSTVLKVIRYNFIL